MGSGDDAKEKILARRDKFVADALENVSLATSKKKPPPQPCLSLPMPCLDVIPPRRIEPDEDSPKPCLKIMPPEKPKKRKKK